MLIKLGKGKVRLGNKRFICRKTNLILSPIRHKGELCGSMPKKDQIT